MDFKTSQKAIARLLECPSCFEYMFAPIYICSAGHNICQNCKEKIRSCPTCRYPFTVKKRNYALEQISVLISYPCLHESNGCPEMIDYAKIKDHEKTCSFRPYPCIVESGCNFHGPRNELMNHCRAKHPVSSWMTEDNEDRWERSSPKTETQVAFCYGEMFYFHRILLDDANMCWVCQFVGNSEDASNFTYKLSFDDGEGKLFSFQDRCQTDLLSANDLIETGRYISLQMQIFETFMDDNETVTYHVSIDNDLV